jgi:predicted kinase
MPHMQWLLITGLPGTGKTTLARRLARRYGAPLLAKDLVKEPLLNVLGAESATDSRRLSDASFAVLIAFAREYLTANLNFILEGNFRPGEHEEALAVLATERMAQVLCRLDEPTRLARLELRKAARHAGHRDADPGVVAQKCSNEFLDLPGDRLAFDSGEPAFGRELDTLDRWWRQS